MNRRILLIALSVLAICTLPELRAQQSTPSHRSKAAPARQQAPQQAEAPVKEDLKRLYLKDGSYQPIMKYQVIGERVRYLSAERYEWEEIPANLIDWPASQKFSAEGEKRPAPARASEVDAERAKERAEEDARSPVVSPGIRLPETGGIFLLDVYQGKPQLNELVQNGADVNKNMAGNILRGAINPVASAKQTIELKGPHARVQSHVGDPFIYVAIDEDQDASNSPDPEKEKKHWRIVRTEEKKGNRVVGNVNIAIYGKVKEKANYIDADVTPVSGPWLKVVPAQRLQPGEYALVELLGEQGMNRFVWDFGVNPSAPENPGGWKPAPTKAEVSGTDKTPVLDQRKP